MNRHSRRAAAARSRGITQSRVPNTHLDLHCVGPFSAPPQICDRHLTVAMPFTSEERFQVANGAGWVGTLTCPPGEVPATTAVLCGSCAEAVLDPELLAAARQRMPGSA